MRRSVAGVIFACVGLTCLCGAAELKLPLLWTANTKTMIESAPTLADLNGDGYQEVLAAAREEMIALDRAGHELWRWRTKGRFMTYPAALERKGQPTLIYAADTSGLLTCLDGAGKVVWQAQLKGPSSWSASVICDLKHDGTFQVVQTDETGAISAFDALTGKSLWQATMKGSPVSPAVGDIDGDGKDEIAVASNAGILAVFNSAGTRLWDRPLGGASSTWATSAPILFGASDGTGRIAAAGAEGRVCCYNAKGDLLWARATRGPIASTLSAGDMDGDGRADIFAVTQTGVIYRYDETGREIWTIDVQGRSLGAGALIDLQNNGQLDYVLCTQSGRLLALNSKGEFVFEHTFDNRTINVTPTFGDVTPKSPGLEMVITGGESGKVFCFGTQAPANLDASLAPWIAYRGDARKTGAWLPSRFQVQLGNEVGAARMFPKGASLDNVVTGEPVRFVINVPTQPSAPMKATATCLRPDGSVQTAVSPILGTLGELPLPVDVVMPGAYRFSWSLTGAKGETLALGAKELFLEPFGNDRALVERALSGLTSAADRAASILPLTASALRREKALLEHESRALEPLEKAMAGGDAAAEQATMRRAASLVAEARRAVGLASAADQSVALGKGTSVVAFESTTWESGGIDRQLPVSPANPLKIERRVVPGEHDPVSVKLFNVTDRALEVRVVVESAPGGPVVTPHRSMDVPTAQGGIAWDPLPELDETSTVNIPSLETREVWLDVRFDAVKPGGPGTPGDHSVKVRFQALNGAGVLDGPTSAQDVPAPETVVELAFKVLPFAMAPSGAVRLCCWASYKAPEIKDLLEHGNNVFCTPSGEPKFDDQGHVTGVDYTKLDELLTLLRGHDAVALIQGIPSLKQTSGTPEYAAELKKFLDDLVAHMAKMGFDGDHFALYPIDEPCGNGWNMVNALVEFGRQVKEVNPAVKIYVDGGGDLPMFQKIAPYVDIWCPALGMLAEQSPKMDLVRGTRKQIWSYDCGYGYTTAMRATLKDTNIVAEYRTAALFAFRYNGGGIGFWSYNFGPDPWMRAEIDYPILYPGKTKPVTSRRWEAVREGIEDFRILAALRKDAESVKDAAVRQRLSHLFDVSLPALFDQSLKEVKMGLGRAVFAISQNENKLAAFRNEMLDCVEAVGAEGK